MSRTVILKSKDTNQRKQVRKALKGLSGFAAICPDLNPDNLQILTYKTERLLICDALAYQYGLENKTFIAIAPARVSEDMHTQVTQMFIFVKNGSIQQIREAKIADAFVSVLQLAISEYESKIVAYKNVDLSLLDALASKHNQKLNIEKIDVQSEILKHFKFLPVEQVLAHNSITNIEKYSISAFVVLGLAVSGLFVNYQVNNEVEIVQNIVNDEWVEYRKSLSGRHVIEDMEQSIKYFNRYRNIPGWELNLFRSNESKFSASFQKSEKHASSSGFLKWVRAETNDDLTFDSTGVKIEGLQPDISTNSYISSFVRYNVDIDLNLSQLNDLLVYSGFKEVDIARVERFGNYKVTSFTLVLEGVSINQIRNVYDSLANIPLVSKDLSVEMVNDGTYQVIHNISLIGH